MPIRFLKFEIIREIGANMGAIILLSGPAGAGKTTVAKELVAAATGPTSYIEGDKFWFFIAKSGLAQNKPRDFKMIMTSMTAAALPYALYGYQVIVDFSFPPWFLDTVRKVVKDKVPVHYIVLRPSEAVCIERAASRKEGRITNYSKYHELYTSFDEVQRNIIADDFNDASVVSDHMREAIDEGMFII